MSADKDIKEQLRKRGTSLHAWAIKNNWPPRTVYTTVERWGHREDRPLGGIGRQIMADLKRELEE